MFSKLTQTPFATVHLKPYVVPHAPENSEVGEERFEIAPRLSGFETKDHEPVPSEGVTADKFSVVLHDVIFEPASAATG